MGLNLNGFDLKSAVDRWTKSKLNFRSSFYTGRGPISCDLDSMMLEGIYRGIKNEVGEQEATNFVNFIDNLKDMSASAFIQAFQKFFYGGLSETNIQGNSRELSGTSQDELFSEGMALIAHSLGDQPNPDEMERASYSIKAVFLRDHEDELINKKPRCSMSRFDLYYK